MAKREVKFESQDRRIAQINKVLNSYGIASIEKPKQFATQKESILIWNVNRLRISVSKMQNGPT